MDRLTVAEAAEALGITQEAVRKRVQRDTIRWEKDADGRLYVYLDRARTHDPDESRHSVLEAKDELIEDLRARVGYLEKSLDTRDEEIRRRDHIIAALTERIPAIEPPSDTPSEAPESPQSSTEAEGKGDGSTSPEDATEPERRSWWRRLFEG